VSSCWIVPFIGRSTLCPCLEYRDHLTLLRAKAERTIAALWDAVGSLIDLFKPNECANYFKAAGYDLE
jgi:hypothetical protein